MRSKLLYRILTNSFFLLIAVKVIATEKDSACHSLFMSKAYDLHRMSYVCVEYIDSQNIRKRLAQVNVSISEQIRNNMQLDEKTALEMLQKDSILTFFKHGKLVGMELSDRAFYNKWIRKGRKRFKKKFFKGMLLKSTYVYRKRHSEMDVFAVAYDLGIIVSFVEENDMITYISECSGK